jgi:hypothetical protein
MIDVSVGIHGVPFKAWNGVGGDSGLQAGYCTHSSILFLPWHRPYLALFEVRSHADWRIWHNFFGQPTNAGDPL